MPIENDIKQTKFRNIHHKMVLNLIYTHNWLVNEQYALLKPFDLTSQQFNVLRILRGQYPNPVRVNDIIERMLDKMSNVSRLVDKLLAKGLVERTSCPHDRRAVDVLITEAGLNLLKEIDAHQDTWEDKLRTLNDDEATQLSDLLDKLRNTNK
ncbi:MAG: MarR family winged helix-turn-helix transcriptional regulator [Runella sp.]